MICLLPLLPSFIPFIGSEGWVDLGLITLWTCLLLVGLYKILFHFEACVNESIILLCPPPTCIARPGTILLHDYWAVYDSPSRPTFVCYVPYNIGNNNIV